MSNELAINNEKIIFTKEQVELIKNQIMFPGATDDEMSLFLYQAKRTGLDPLTRQIYALERRAKDKNGNWTKKLSIQTSIDGFRVIAERSGDYAGQSEPEFIEENGNLVSVKITVFRFRGDTRYPAAVGVAHMSEYMPKPPMDGMWVKMPHIMLAKVAEAQALRKAYPQDLSGIYTEEEIRQSDDVHVNTNVTTKNINNAQVIEHKEKATNEQLEEIEDLVKTLDEYEWLERCMKKANARMLSDFTKQQAEMCLLHLNKKVDEAMAVQNETL